MPSLFCRCEEDWSWPDLMGTETVWRKGEHKNLINTMFNYQVSPHVNSATHVHMISIHQTSSMIITIQKAVKIKENIFLGQKRTYMQHFFCLIYISSKEKHKGSVLQALCTSKTNDNIAIMQSCWNSTVATNVEISAKIIQLMIISYLRKKVDTSGVRW